MSLECLSALVENCLWDVYRSYLKRAMCRISTCVRML